MAIWIFIIVAAVGIGIFLIIKFIKKNIPKSDIEEALNEFKEEIHPKPSNDLPTIKE